MIAKICKLYKKALGFLVDKKAYIYILMSLLMVGPYIYMTRYSFPSQDDFDYANNARTLMEEGYSVLGQALHMTAKWHMEWGGLYSSTFFGYLFSGIVMGSVRGVRIFEFCSGLFFVIALAVFAYAMTRYIFNLSKKEAATSYAYLCIFMFGVVYYGDFDVLYWFITSIQYLMLIAFMLLGIAFYIFAIKAEVTWKKRTYYIWGAICGIIAAGANLCVSGLNLFWYCLILLIVILRGELKDKKAAIIPPVIMFVCSMINGLAPGNYKRSSGGRDLSQMITALRSSVRFLLERYESYFLKPEFWIAFVALVLATLFIPREKRALGFIVRWPLIIIGCLTGVLAAVIFPAMLGYSYDVFVYLIRCQFVLDLTLFSFLVFGVLLIEQWIYDKYGMDGINLAKKDIFLAGLCIILGLCLQLRDNKWRWVGIARQYRDVDAGRGRDYSNYFLGILSDVEKSESDIAVVYVDEEIVEKTSQINPLIGYDDCYDPEERYLNNAIAHYYKKKGVWVLHSDYVASDEDREVAKKYGVEDQLR